MVGNRLFPHGERAEDYGRITHKRDSGISPSSAPGATSPFPFVFFFGLYACLPLHIFMDIFAATTERDNMIDYVALTGACSLVGSGTGMCLSKMAFSRGTTVDPCLNISCSLVFFYLGVRFSPRDGA
jgi:hypothetical protein